MCLPLVKYYYSITISSAMNNFKTFDAYCQIAMCVAIRIKIFIYVFQ